jgi:outer membrane protein
MKNLSLILNGVLLLLVAVLYYFHFAKNPSSSVSTGGSFTPTDLKIAFVNYDSILKNYEYFKANREKLEAKVKKLDQDLNNRAQSFRNDYESYQRNQGSLTMGQAKAIEEDLGKKQQNLQLYQQSLTQEMTADEAKLTQALYGRITEFLKKYCHETGLQVVFKFDTSSDILFGSVGLDVTKDVVNGLNIEYKSEKDAPGAGKDSTAVKKK